MAEFLHYLDAEYGQGQYLLFLTSDHGVVPNIEYLQSQGISAKRIDYDALRKELEQDLKNEFNAEGLIKGLAQGNVYLDLEIIEQKNLKLENVARFAANALNKRLVF